MNQKQCTFFLTLLCAFACLSACASQSQAIEQVSSLTAEEIRQIEETTWRIELRTDIKNTQIDAVQFSIFQTDPLVLLKERRNLSAIMNEGKNLTAFDRQIDLEVDWNLLFDEISGRDVFLIKANAGKKDSNIISANTENSTKWVVTKVVYKKDGSFITWIVPFDSQIGTTQLIELTDKNAFDISNL